MLLALAQWLAQDVRFFNVFNYMSVTDNCVER